MGGVTTVTVRRCRRDGRLTARFVVVSIAVDVNWYRDFILRTVWVSDNYRTARVARRSGVWCLAVPPFVLGAVRKIALVGDTIGWVRNLTLVVVDWLGLRFVFVRLTRYVNWYRDFVLRTVWVGDDYRTTGITWLGSIWRLAVLPFVLGAVRKVTLIGNSVFGIWRFAFLNGDRLRLRRVLVRIRGWVGWVSNVNRYRHFVSRAIWVGNDNRGVLVTRRSGVWRLAILTSVGGAVWQVTLVGDPVGWVRRFTLVDIDVLALRIVLISLAVNVNRYRYFIGRAVWVGDNHRSGLVTWRGRVWRVLPSVSRAIW